MRSQSASKDSKEFSSQIYASKTKLIKAALQFLFLSKNSNVQTHYSYYGRTKLRVLLYSILDVLKKKYRSNFINNNLSRKIQDEPLIFYPLQTEPERALLLGAPFFTDQLRIIKDIAKSLPIKYKLYVKEHPGQLIRGWRKTSFYKEILKLPNVKLIHPAISSDDIFERASLVITAGGTAGFEAAFYGKPSITFVETLYSELSSVYTLQGLHELPEAIQTSLQRQVDPNDLSRFIAKLERNSFEFPFIELEIEMANLFYYGGFLLDANIEPSKMKLYLEKFGPVFDGLALEHIKKIKQYKTYQSTKQ
jgi:hypothetical protein